jgi:hypothetical protein
MRLNKAKRNAHSKNKAIKIAKRRALARHLNAKTWWKRQRAIKLAKARAGLASKTVKKRNDELLKAMIKKRLNLKNVTKRARINKIRRMKALYHKRRMAIKRQKR